MDNIIKQHLTGIWYLFQQGEHNKAKQLVVNLLQNNQECIPAWFLLAECLDTPEEKSKCYRRIRELDKNNEITLQCLRLQDIERNNKVMISPFRPNLIDGDENQYSTNNQSVDETIDLENVIEVDENQANVYKDDLTHDSVLVTYIINELGSHVDEDDIIREVSLRAQINWYDADKFVNEIKDKHSHLIAKHRSPLLLIVAIPTLVAGTVWFILTVVYFIAHIKNAIFLDFIPVLLQSSRHFVISISMLLGGVVGIYRVLKSLGKIR